MKTRNITIASTLLAALAVPVSLESFVSIREAVGAPSPTTTTQVDNRYCLTDSDAYEAASIFQELIQEYSDDLAVSALTEDFVDYSSAVSIIINTLKDGASKDMVAPTFDGRQAFMNAQGSQPKIPFKKLNIFHGCDSVSMRWVSPRSAQGQAREVSNIVSPSSHLILTSLTAPLTIYAPARRRQRHNRNRRSRSGGQIQFPHQNNLLRIQHWRLAAKLGRISYR